MISDMVFMTSFTEHNVFVKWGFFYMFYICFSRCSMYQYFVPFYCRVVFHGPDVPQIV